MAQTTRKKGSGGGGGGGGKRRTPKKSPLDGEVDAQLAKLQCLSQCVREELKAFQTELECSIQVSHPRHGHNGTQGGGGDTEVGLQNYAHTDSQILMESPPHLRPTLTRMSESLSRCAVQLELNHARQRGDNRAEFAELFVDMKEQLHTLVRAQNVLNLFLLY
jgi:hypothetical protein